MGGWVGLYLALVDGCCFVVVWLVPPLATRIPITVCPYNCMSIYLYTCIFRGLTMRWQNACNTGGQSSSMRQAPLSLAW